MMMKTAIVTGASRGIGAATARAFARAGYAVVLAARNVTELESIAGEILSAGGRALAVPTDVTDPASVESLVKRAVAEFGALDVAFNNAGGGAPPKPLAEIDPAAFESALRVNLFGTFLCMRSQIRAMKERGAGSIVNMSSTAGLQGVSGLGPYCAGKHAIIGLTKAAALDYASDQIRINVVAPGPIGTDRFNEEQRARIARFVPAQRVGTPNDVAELVLWLSSSASNFITGAVIPIDGGRMAGTPSFAVSP
ncbi:MAG TPA: SDR family NAD(P)-dependent oxidoreductase [Candidatus Tumulicola sp.]|jgi:NAD(P)-dependent dehydrogenase (short-subunit alcohol dehydrogenase family)